MAENKSKNIVSKNPKLSEKLGVYGSNYGAHFLDTIKNSGETIASGLGNPYAAVGFGAWDILSNTMQFKGNLADRLVKTGGFAYFFGKSIYDLGSAVAGNYDNLVEFPFDALMAMTLGKDVKRGYNNSGRSFSQDFKDLGSYVSNAGNFVGKTISNSCRKLENKIKNSDNYVFGRDSEDSGNKND